MKAKSFEELMKNPPITDATAKAWVSLQLAEHKANEVRMGHDRVCQCGDCKDAARASYRMYTQLKESGHCDYWVMQIIGGLVAYTIANQNVSFGVKAEEMCVPAASGEMPEGISEERANEIRILSFMARQEIDAIAEAALFSAMDSGDPGAAPRVHAIAELHNKMGR